MGRSPLRAKKPPESGAELSFEQQHCFPQTKFGQDNQCHHSTGLKQRRKGIQHLVQFTGTIQAGEIGENKIIRAFIFKPPEIGVRA
jgi:hypothetical protein